MDRKYILWKKSDSNNWVDSDPEYGTDFVLEQIKNGANIEIRHSLLDSVLVSNDLDEQIEDSKQIRNTTNKKKVQSWNISEVQLTGLYDQKLVYKAFEKTTLLKSIIVDYKKKKQNEKSFIDKVKDFLPFITIILFIFSTYDFLTKDVKIEVQLRPMILLIIGIAAFFSFIIIFIKNRNNQRKHCLENINKSLNDLSKADINEVLLVLSPEKCYLNKHCINLIINAHNCPQIILEILRSFMPYQTNEQISNKANIVFSLKDMPLPFYDYDKAPICRLELIPLTLNEKISFFESKGKSDNEQKDFNTKTLLKFLGIDIIENNDSVKDLEKERVFSKFDTEVKEMANNTKQSPECILYLLYICSYLANIKGRNLRKNEIFNLLCKKDDCVNELCNATKKELSIPVNLDVDKSDTIAKEMFDFFDGKSNKCESKGYRFSNYIETVMYLCESRIKGNIRKIIKLCILNAQELFLKEKDKNKKIEEICTFAKKACDFLIDNYLNDNESDKVNFRFYSDLLKELEQQGLIYFHYVIFKIICEHIEVSKNLKQDIAKSPDIIRSAFMSLVHYPDEEVLELHTQFVKYCASTRQSVRLQTPQYMDIIILESKVRNEYYKNLKSIEKDEEKNETLKFINALYLCYCASLKNSNIIGDSFFFINKSLIDADKTTILDELTNLCKNRYDVVFKGSKFDDFIEDIKLIFDKKPDKLPDFDCERELYSFLIKLYYYANNSILEEKFPEFVNLIVESENLGISTRCELMSEFAFYQNYQKRRIDEFLTRNVGKLKAIMEVRVQEERFTLELAYKSIPNINYISGSVSGNSEKIDLKDFFVDQIKNRFKDESNTFIEDVNVLMYRKIFDCKNIKNFTDKVSKIDEDLVVLVLCDVLNDNEDLANNLIREYFESLKKARLVNRITLMVSYLNNDSIIVNQSNIDILNYLISIIDNIKIKNDLLSLQRTFIKWRSLISDSYKVVHIRTIKQIYKLRELKIKTDAKENHNETLEEDLCALEIEKNNEIEAFNNRETTREVYSTKSVRRRQNG